MKHFYAAFSTGVRWIIVFWSYLGLLAGPASAAGVLPAGAAAGSTPSLAQALNPDGTLRAGAQGSFDARLFRMHTAPDGRPSFSPTSTTGTGDESWQDNFRLAGTNGTVYKVLQVGSATYIAGSFSQAGGVAAGSIVKWDGTTWSSLGTGTANGVVGVVYDVIASGTDLYVAGTFLKAGGVTANRVAKWNGTAWSSLGTGKGNGINYDEVRALAMVGTTLYAGGQFYEAGGVPATGIAKWDGASWSAVGGGVATPTTGGSVNSLAVSGTTLYVGGGFSFVGGVAANNIAQWDGTAWSAVGAAATNGVNGIVADLAVAGTDLYVVGGFKLAGATVANNVAKWSGTAWSSLGTGTANGTDNATSAVFVAGGNVYVGGYFGNAGGVKANSIAKWNGTSWSGFGSGDENGVSTHSFFTTVTAIALVGTDLYLGGTFTTAGTKAAKYLTRWNGTSWNSVGPNANGADNEVYAVAVSGTDVYVGGNFTSVGSVRASHIAKWNGTSWSALGYTAAPYGYYYEGVSGPVYALLVSGTSLYVGGYFSEAGDIAANNVARWDGTTWRSLGTGTANGVGLLTSGVPYVYALAQVGTSVYVGGYFTKAGGVAAGYIARWNGTAWSNLGTGTTNGLNYSVYALAVSGASLYVGGGFSTAGGTAATNIAKWDGTTWSTLGAGATNGSVQALLVSGTSLYAGGSFTSVGGVAANTIAKWDGSTWSPLGSGTLLANGSARSSVTALAILGNTLYAGGDFGRAGGVAASNIAKWDGSAWSALGTGLSAPVRSLGAGPGTRLHVGGLFSTVGDNSKGASFFTSYDTALLLAALPAAAASPIGSLYPNPAHAGFSVRVPGMAAASMVQAELFNSLGQVVRRQAAALPAAGTLLHFESTGLAPGVYTLRLQAGAGTSSTQRVVIQ